MALTIAGTAAAQDPDIQAGKEVFALSCVQCHGIDATGDGPMAELIAIDTPDLTGLARRNDGIFPTLDVAQKIDGRAQLLAHGGDMPVFGRFLDRDQSVALRLPNGQPVMVTQPLADLVVYLESLQVE
jgi:mono/diheme cytochrome c family protein